MAVGEGDCGTTMMGFAYRALRKTVYRRTASELAASTAYFDELLYDSAGDDGLLFDLLVADKKHRMSGVGEMPDKLAAEDSRRVVVLDGVLNNSLDIQSMLQAVRGRMGRGDRLALVLYNPYLRWIYALADRLGLRSAPPVTTFLTRPDLLTLLRVSSFALTRVRNVSPVPFRLAGLGTLVDAFFRAMPFLRQLSPVQVVLARPIVRSEEIPSLSVIVPARNERGNIADAVERFPKMHGVDVEIIFVEGHSSDGTWEEIQRVVARGRPGIGLRALRQEGIGKADAVRLGFAEARGDLLTILDADLTVPPELIPRFYEAYREGHGDFCNGSRLVYPMESKAMRYLNWVGNVFFAKFVSWVLETRVGDTLCGTKLLARRDYERMVRWRRDFGDFDPFGDFELLFPAAILGLGIVDVPIRYGERTYGQTNISRFRHGWDLMRMAVVGFVKIRMGMGRYAARRSGR